MNSARAAVLVSVLAIPSIGLGQLNRTGVSVIGNDANPCTTTAPCRTLARALMETNSGGEILVLTSGGYGALTIDQNVSVVAAPGVYAGVTATGGGNAITITLPANEVILRGLTITTVFDGTTGITAADNLLELFVENCSISNFAQQGLNVTGSGGSIEVFVTDSAFRSCGIGIQAQADSGFKAAVSVDRSRFESNGQGVTARDSSEVIVRDSLAAANTDLGFQADAVGVSTTATLTVVNSVATNNGWGVYAAFSDGAGTSLVRLHDCTVTHNVFGLAKGTGGSTVSFGTNAIRANGTDGAPDSTIGLQ